MAGPAPQGGAGTRWFSGRVWVRSTAPELQPTGREAACQAGVLSLKPCSGILVLAEHDIREMSEDRDTTAQGRRYFGVSRRTLVLEAVRLSYAAALGGIVTLGIAFGLSLFEAERLGLPGPAISLLPLLCILLSAVLYVYDRRHERDLVVADFALLIARPFAAVYDILRTGGR